MVSPNSRKTAKLLLELLFLLIIALFCLTPIINQIAVSLSSRQAVIMRRVGLLPVELCLESYKLVLQHPYFARGYLNTLIYAAVSTALALGLTSLAAFALSKKRIRLSKLFMAMILVTMIYSGGLIPYYLLIKNLGLINSRWAIFLPQAINPFLLVIARAFFNTIPNEMEECATIDGANAWQGFWYIAMPLSKPILATLTVYYGVEFWKDWWQAFLFITNLKLQPITLFLRNLMEAQNIMNKSTLGITSSDLVSISYENLMAAALVCVAFPLILLYPFLQKYFVRGIMVGAIKG